MSRLNERLNVFRCRLPLIALMVCLVAICRAQFGEGDGTQQNPWEISRPQHLDAIRGFLGAEHGDKYYVQRADINLDVAPYNQEEGWIPIGTEAEPFTGNYSGNGYVITGLTIDRASSYQGLFGYCNNATIRQLALEGVDISRGGYRSGAISGFANGTTVIDSYVTGTVSTATSSQTSAFIGAAFGCTITNCWADVEYTTAGSWDGILIGTCYGGTVVRNSYTLGSITQTVAGRQNIGAMFGMLTGATVINSYSRARVIVPENSNRVGSLIGRNLNGTITNCYATGRITAGEGSTVGGLTGANGGGCQNSYWDTETTETEESANGSGRLTRQMAHPYDLNTTYIEWDFEEIWQHDEAGDSNDGYPMLFYQELIEPDQLDTPEVTVSMRMHNNQMHLFINWEAVEEANSYNVYISNYPSSDDWGEPHAVVTGTEFSEPIDDNANRFYHVTASPEEGDGRRSSRDTRERASKRTSAYEEVEFDESRYDIYGNIID